MLEPTPLGSTLADIKLCFLRAGFRPVAERVKTREGEIKMIHRVALHTRRIPMRNPFTSRPLYSGRLSLIELRSPTCLRLAGRNIYNTMAPDDTSYRVVADRCASLAADFLEACLCGDAHHALSKFHKDVALEFGKLDWSLSSEDCTGRVPDFIHLARTQTSARTTKEFAENVYEFACAEDIPSA